MKKAKHILNASRIATLNESALTHLAQRVLTPDGDEALSNFFTFRGWCQFVCFVGLVMRPMTSYGRGENSHLKNTDADVRAYHVQSCRQKGRDQVLPLHS